MDALLISDLVYFIVFWFSRILTTAIFIRIMCSWLRIRLPDILFAITEPILEPFRKMINNSPLGGSMFDFSPIISMVLIRVIADIILGAL